MVWPCKRLDRTSILKKALELKLKGKTLVDDPEQDGSTKCWKTVRRNCW
jgi:hypothetical protein